MKHITLSKLAKLRGAESYWRCGARHTREGATYPEDRFTPEELRRLEADPMLEVTDVDAPVPTEAERQGELAFAVRQRIEDLSAGEFTKTGKPQIGAIRSRMADWGGAELTSDAVNEVYAQMVADGFEVPVEKPADPPNEPQQPAPPPPAQQRDDAQGQG